jgi:putative transposase
MGDTFRARSTSKRRAVQCPGSNRRRWIKKLNLSPNISATPSHLPNSETDTASVARPATNGSIAIRQKDRLDWRRRSRRPHSSPDETPEPLRLAIIEARRRHPSWGGKKLLKHLKSKDPQADWPSRSTVCDILLRAGLVRQKTRLRKPGHPGKPISIATAPSDICRADFKGHFKTRDGHYCYPLTVTDLYSRYMLGCRALLSTETEGAIETFLKLFKKYGLPQATRSDNGTPFASTALARLSELSVWWIRLGIRPELIEPGKPQQNGQHERMHPVLKTETARPPAASLTQQQRSFDRFRHEYNQLRPYEGIDLLTSASLYAPSSRPMPAAPPPSVYPAHFETRLVSKNSGIPWRDKWVAVSTTCAGLHVGLEEIDHGLWYVYLGPVKLGRLLEETLRIEDHLGRLKRINA